MTVREIYDATITEINKENSQSFTIEEFNYTLNKAIIAFENEKYNFYAVNQQLTDDLRVFIKNQTFNITDISVEEGDDTVPTFNPITGYLTENRSGETTAVLSTVQDLEVNNIIQFGNGSTTHTISNITNTTITFAPGLTASRGDRVFKSTPLIAIPAGSIARTIEMNFVSSDYVHLISCRVLWKNKRSSTDEVSIITFPAQRLTYDMLNAIQNNTYLSPAPNRPYYQTLNHINNGGIIGYSIADYKANQNRPKMKIHIGNKNSYMELRSVEFDYVKFPEKVTLFDSDVFSVGVDTSQILELPDYLINELVKRCVSYLLERSGDPRIQSYPIFNQEIPTVPISMMAGSTIPKKTTDKTQ